MALAHIMDPFILTLIFARIFLFTFLHSVVIADIGSQRSIKVIGIVYSAQIPFIIVAAVLIVKFSTTTDIVLNIHYIGRKWLIAADFLSIIMRIYIVMYLRRDRGISSDIHEESSIAVKAQSTISYIANGFIFILKYTILNICFTILVCYITFFSPSAIVVLQNYLTYNQLSAYSVVLNCLLTPTILCLQIFIFNVVKKVGKASTSTRIYYISTHH